MTTPQTPTQTPTQTGPRLSFQLYTARHDPRPLPEVLAALAGMGLGNVEPHSGLYDDPEALAAALDAAGLACPSGHFDLEMLEADPARAIAIARRLGMTLVVAPWLEPEDRPTDAAGWQALGARLEAIRPGLAEAGLTLAWHNHDFEFVPLADGSLPIDHLLGATAAGIELDLAWVLRAGRDPLPWITAHAARILAVHVKDLAPAGEKPDEDGWITVGQGLVDWPAAWAALAATPAGLAVLEHDEPKDWQGFARDSAAAVARLAAEVAA